ncbi:MAG: DNA polymerase III subunit delta [Chloroflexi bacterium]|jgi:DNA polymerase-3 subunit delta|nr:DNA polymerase III subunit delta [Chloroflexota bacterium]
MIYLLQGENELEREEAAREIIDAAGIPQDLREVNTEVLTPPVSAAELRRACSTIPFMGGTRVILARNVLRQKDKDAMKAIAAYLPDVPDSTCLIFLEEKRLSKRHAVLKAAQKHDAKIRTFALPNAKSLPGWIQRRTQQRGGKISPRAAAHLAQNLGANLRLLDQEIQKLMLYRAAGEAGDEASVITLEDVKTMVPYIQSADVIFNLVDALGQRRPRNAARYLHRLLETGSHPLAIFGMIVRQYRLLIQVRWLVDEGTRRPKDIASRLKLHPYVAKKVSSQTVYFTSEQLRAAYQLLMETDLSIKTGQLKPEAALDLLISQLTSL